MTNTNYYAMTGMLLSIRQVQQQNAQRGYGAFEEVFAILNHPQNRELLRNAAVENGFAVTEESK